jgi:A/G-specific adenine glycosylase
MNVSHPISDLLIDWYRVNKRDLPWRRTNDPYKIWLSEIILQQTQVVQGISYYLKFIEEFPTIKDLADAKDDKVMLLWQGLGYYSRARNLLVAARKVRDSYNGKFPSIYLEIKELKGVGDYTAAAIASIAFNLPHAVVDGNVYRVLSRLYDIHIPINASEGKKQFQLLANELLNTKKAKLHNSAMMEFGALFCKPQNPDCASCVLRNNCLAFQNNNVHLLPVKNKTIKIKNRFFYYFSIRYKDEIYIQKRVSKDIWQNLYEFYLIEQPAQIDDHKAIELFKSKLQLKKFNVVNSCKQNKHILSHQHIFSTIFEIEVTNPLKSDSALIPIEIKNINKFGFPQLLVRYIKQF